jgi:hypothetical protein
MKVLDAYQIPILSLEDKSYRYTFEGADDFFQAFEQDWVEKGQFRSVVELNKSATMIQVELKIEEILKKYNYQFYRIYLDKLKKVDTLVNNEDTERDYLFIHPDKLSQINKFKIV